eukprot:399568-Pelagomonas_calceolata.AAC.1
MFVLTKPAPFAKSFDGHSSSNIIQPGRGHSGLVDLLKRTACFLVLEGACAKLEDDVLHRLESMLKIGE